MGVRLSCSFMYVISLKSIIVLLSSNSVLYTRKILQRYKKIPSKGTKPTKNVPSKGTKTAKNVPFKGTKPVKNVPLKGTKPVKNVPLKGTFGYFVWMHRIESQCYHRVSGVWSIAYRRGARSRRCYRFTSQT